MSRISALIPTAVAGAAAGGVVALAIAGSGGGSSKTVTSVVTQSAGGVSIPTSLTKTQGMTINQIYRADSPGVVDITVVSEQNTGVNLLGQSTQQQSEGEGAGVVYDKNGDILTDEHVVKG